MRKSLYTLMALMAIIVSIFVLASPQGVGPAQIVPAYTLDDASKKSEMSGLLSITDY